MWHVFATSPTDTDPLSWRHAWQAAALGEFGFYRQADCRPADHFRTSAHIGGPFAAAIFDRLRGVDERLAHPSTLTVVDVGAGGGELLNALAGLIAASDPGLAGRVELIGVDLRDRPEHLRSDIGWIKGLAPVCVPADITGMIVATELLDDIPIDIAELDATGDWRYLRLDSAGVTSLGEVLTSNDQKWVDAFAGRSELSAGTGTRVEIGITRDTIGYDLTSRLVDGDALFIDYVSGTGSSLRAFRHGHEVAPVTDGSMNITAAVHQRSLTSTLTRFGDVHVQDQANALAEYQRPREATEMPMMARLQWRSAWQELTDRAGLGSHSWISLTRTNTDLPQQDAKQEMSR